MASIYRKPGTRFLWGKWSDGAGNVQRGSLETEDEVEAQARVDELERIARGETAPAASPGELTVEGFVGTPEAPGEWLKLRKVAKPLAWRDDLSRLRHHFFKTFGARPLTWLATDDGSRAISSWAMGLRAHTAQRDGKPLAPRSVWNTYSVAKVLLDDAVELRRLERNPLATFRTGKYLPEKADKLDGWRETAGFEMDQVVSLTTDARLRPHRLVWNTLAFMVGGARTGELANLRWRDWTESHKGGLGKLSITSAYNTREKVEKGTKTGAKKLIPVHPYAARVLKAWRDGGWREWMGSKEGPKPEDDLIVPRSDGKQWGNGQLLDQFHADLKLLSIPKQRQYENRSTFRNLLLRAGAPEFMVNLMTHPAPKQASDYYTRLDMQWPALCSAILLLDAPAWDAPETEGTGQGTGDGSTDQKAPSLDSLGPERLAGCTGLENARKPAPTWPDRTATAPHRTAPPSRPYLYPVPTRPHDSAPLPAVSAELFIEAAAIVARRTPGDAADALRKAQAHVDALTR